MIKCGFDYSTQFRLSSYTKIIELDLIILPSSKYEEVLWLFKPIQIIKSCHDNPAWFWLFKPAQIIKSCHDNPA